MTFERSGNGQANRAAFYDVDITCYVEGTDQAETGDDVYFWNLVFSTLNPELQVKFLARGGKPQLQSLAKSVVDNDIKDVLVAMDADYCRFFPDRLIDDRRVFYTFGYCWENDVFAPGVDESAYVDVTRSQSIPNDAIEFQRGAWSKLERAFSRLLRADFEAFRRKSSVVDGSKPGQFFSRDEHGLPEFSKCNALIRIVAIKNSGKLHTPREYLSVPNEPFRYIKGKLIAHCSRQILATSGRRFANAKQITEAHSRSICLAIFRDRLRKNENDAIASHYCEQAARLAA